MAKSIMFSNCPFVHSYVSLYVFIHLDSRSWLHFCCQRSIWLCPPSCVIRDHTHLQPHPAGTSPAYEPSTPVPHHHPSTPLGGHKWEGKRNLIRQTFSRLWNRLWEFCWEIPADTPVLTSAERRHRRDVTPTMADYPSKNLNKHKGGLIYLSEASCCNRM